jgi:hypothetical protein
MRRYGKERTVLATVVAASAIQLILVASVAVSNAQTSGYTPRGYKYDNKTCSAGFRTCMDTYRKQGWQNGAASTYCQQACGVFPQQSFADRNAPW